VRIKNTKCFSKLNFFGFVLVFPKQRNCKYLLLLCCFSCFLLHFSTVCFKGGQIDFAKLKLLDESNNGASSSTPFTSPAPSQQQQQQQRYQGSGDSNASSTFGSAINPGGVAASGVVPLGAEANAKKFSKRSSFSWAGSSLSSKFTGSSNSSASTNAASCSINEGIYIFNVLFFV
jgi:hypothetical protein